MRDLLPRLPGKRILVVGDVMLDEYIWGTVRRISQEAPVPVVEFEKRSHIPGGAANAAANVVGLQGTATLLGVIGADDAGRNLCQILAKRGIDPAGLLVDAERPTTLKTRILAHSQQVVRLDQEKRSGPGGGVEKELLRRIDEELPRADACILSDYAKGVVSATVARHLLGRAGELSKPVVVDPKGADYAKYRGATVVKPNVSEVTAFLGRDAGDSFELAEAGRRLLAECGAAVLITRGAAGMSLFERGREPVHIPSRAREVYDVTGAGDTVVSTVAMALAAGADLETAARLASEAAAVVVGRVGTTAVRLDQLAGDIPTDP